MDFPENFDRLYAGEMGLRAQSAAAISKTSVLADHATVIEANISLVRHLILRNNHVGDDDLTIRQLGVRASNDIFCALSLLLTGYYQASVLIQRDLVETVFLLESFALNKTEIAEWRQATRKQMKERFAPAVVRKRLDTHHSHTERKREAAYRLFSELGGHPHPKGFSLLKNDAGMTEVVRSSVKRAWMQLSQNWLGIPSI